MPATNVTAVDVVVMVEFEYDTEPPAGAVESDVIVNAAVDDDPATSNAVALSVPGTFGLAPVHVYVNAYGDGPEELLPAADQPVPAAGKSTRCMPEPPSVAVMRTSKLAGPANVGL